MHIGGGQKKVEEGLKKKQKNVNLDIKGAGQTASKKTRRSRAIMRIYPRNYRRLTSPPSNRVLHQALLFPATGYANKNDSEDVYYPGSLPSVPRCHREP